MTEAEDWEVEAILGETLTLEETLEEGEIPETPEEIQQEEIEQAITSLARNPTLSMEIDPRWRDLLWPKLTRTYHAKPI